MGSETFGDVMTLQTGQFGGVFWGDGSAETRVPGHEGYIQGMLFHPLWGTGIIGDPSLKEGERQKDVMKAFGVSNRELEYGGIPRTLLGTPEDNPKIEYKKMGNQNAAGLYNSRSHSITMDANAKDDPDTYDHLTHEIGHARDINLKGHTQFVEFDPLAEGAADGFADRMSGNSTLRPELSMTHEANPNRVDEIQREPITHIDNRVRLTGYAANSHVWKTKTQQALYSAARYLGALSPEGTLPKVRESNFSAGEDYDLSKSSLSKNANPIFSRQHFNDNLTLGKLYKEHEGVRSLLDKMGLKDAGEFASAVHTHHENQEALGHWYARQKVRNAIATDTEDGRVVNRTNGHTGFTLDTYRTGKFEKTAEHTYTNPTLFDEIDSEIVDPKPEVQSYEELKKSVKKPSKRNASEWSEMKKAHAARKKEKEANDLNNIFKL